MEFYQKTLKLISDNIKKTFPFRDKKELSDFDLYSKKYYAGLKNIDSDEEFFMYAKEFVAQMRNSHNRIGGSWGKTFRPKDYKVIIVEKKFLLKKRNEVLGEVLLIDGRKPKDILLERKKTATGSTKQLLDRGAEYILSSQKSDPVKLKLKIGGKISYRIINRYPVSNNSSEKIVEFKMFNGTIGYLRAASFIDEPEIRMALENKIKYFAKVKPRLLIIDIRGNLGGSSHVSNILASRFFNKKVLFGFESRRINKDSIKLKKSPIYLNPREPYLNMPIIILVDAGTFSASESFCAGLKDNRRALMIGETTGGAGIGDVKKFDIPFRNFNLSLFVSTAIFLRPNGKLAEGKGIRPHIVVRPTVKGMVVNGDEALERAMFEARKIFPRKAILKHIQTI